jgi:hypothetical protein
MTHALEQPSGQETRDALVSAAAEYAHTEAKHYADPGYQSDGKRRYALDSEAQCRAAWSYINQPDNAAKYSPEDLKKVKAAIKAAGRKYGIDFAEDNKVTATAELRDIELARAGSWKLASGPLEVSDEMLADAARFANREGARPGYLKIGHTDTRFMAGDGEPALGWLHNIRLEEDDEGHVLKGDLHDVPDWLAEAIPRHWPDRSIEGYADYTHDGQQYGLVVDGLALLGVTPPGMPSIRSLRDLPAALGVAASGALEPNGTRIVASFGDPPSPASYAEDPPPISKGAGMEPDEIREALGLPSDASPDEVHAVVDGAFPRATPVAASTAPGTIVLASSTYEQMQRDIKVLTDHVAKTKRDERDEIIAKAVQAGKFTPAQKIHFSKLWDADPDGTRAVIDSLTPNSALAVMASGYAGEGVEADELDREIERLSPPKGKVA